FSMQYHALHLFRDLIAFHIDDKDPTVLVNIDLQRLEFVRMHATFEGPDLALRYTLEQMENMYIGNETVAEIYYQLASGYNASSSLYQPLESDEHKRDLLIAAQYCRNATEEFPGSYGARLCQNLLKQIEAKSLNTTVEYGNLPAKSILASLAFRNVKTVFVRIVALDPTEEQKWNRSRDEHYKIEQYRKLRPEKHWAVELPIEIDHNGHITEFAIPPLTEGYYGLMVSDNPAFDNTKGVVNINSFWVSGISYISNKEGNGDYRFYVLDRLTGHPLPHVDIKVYAEVYNQQIREFDMVKRFDLKSDDSGAFLLPAGEGQNGRLLLEFINGPDRFISPNYFYSSRINKPDARPVNITYFFTDRSIYRPGQTIYFKGILVERIAENYELRKNTATTVNFYDANRQLISSLPLESNEYGSIHGSFIAPSGLLTGTMRIQNETGSTGISVEEYKRPRFELVFDPVKGSYKLGTEVRVTGKAVAYSGQAIDQAAVKYRIVRNAFRPYPYFRGDYPFYSETAEIGSGTTITDAEGKFSIDFKAIPDKNARQMFSFTVYVDVTDPGGETHSEEKNVFVGDKSLLIKLEIPELVNGRDNPVFPLETTNLNGEAEPATINVKITKLQGPGKVYKDRKWSQKPDVYLLGEEKFRELFPGFAYRDENERMHWKDSEVLISKVVDSRSEKELRLEGLSGWGPGEYRIDMKAKDIFGEDVTVTR
ncbi:MAG TPA: MG2 domain-containing protein, partial [Bacteroidales bacterium]|nr:MG2 domain-containing protein [Bacteroidales bacterium]